MYTVFFKNGGQADVTLEVAMAIHEAISKGAQFSAQSNTDNVLISFFQISEIVCCLKKPNQ